MRILILAAALVGLTVGTANACGFHNDVAETPKPIVTADGKVILPTTTPGTTKTGG